MGNRIFLVRHKGDFRCHAHKLNMAAIVFTGTDTVKQYIIGLAQILPAVNIPENPVFKSVLDHFLLLLCQHRLLAV